METIKRFNIGKYVYITNQEERLMFQLLPIELDTDDGIKNFDIVLHQSLERIFNERCSSNNSSSQFKKFHDDPQLNTDWKSIIGPILEQEPALSKYFSKEKLGKFSLLWISVLCGYTDSAELLVRSGADVNELFGRHDPQIIEEESTILHLLLQMHSSPENERLIRLIVDRGADLQARDRKKKTVLHYALASPWADTVEMIEILLEKGADVNAADQDSITPLLIAAHKGQASVLVPLFVKHGADIFAKSDDGMNILHHLALFPKHNVVGIARLFIEKGVSLIDEIIDSRSQPIHLATASGNVELVKLFLDHGADVNLQNVHGKSPLHLAVQHFIKSAALIETLLKRGANIEVRAMNDRAVLNADCISSSEIILPSIIVSIMDTIQLLLSSGADLLAQDSDGNTPLSLMLGRENVELPGTRLLIKMLALQKARQPSIELMDETVVKWHPTLQNYYQDCIEEIDRMKSTRFIHNCTFFGLISKKYCQIADLMRNPDFETKFKEFNHNEFSTYSEDIRRAFKRAQNHYQRMLEQENVINEAVYNILPDLVVEKVVHYIFDCC